MFNPRYAMRIGVDGARQANRDINGIAGNVDNLGRTLQRAARFAVGLVGVAVGIRTIQQAAREWLRYADQVSKGAEQAGIATEEFSALAYAGELSQVSVNDLSTSLRNLNRVMVEAQREGGQQSQIFRALNIETRNADGTMRDANEVMMELADRFQELPDGATKATLAQRLFGRSGEGMISMLNRGSDGLRELRNEAEDAGRIISEEAGKAAEDFNDNLTRLRGTLQGLANQYLPATIQMVDRLMNALMPASAPAPTASRMWEEAIEESSRRIIILRDQIESLGTRRNRPERENLLAELDAEEARLAALEHSLQRIQAREAEMAPPAPSPTGRTDTGSLDEALSGGRSGVDADARAAQRIIEATRTPQEQFMARMEVIERLYLSGEIAMETYNRAALSYVDTLQEQEIAANRAQAANQAAFDSLMGQLYPNDAAARQWLRDYKLLAEYLEGPELDAALDRLNQRFAGTMEQQRTFADEWVDIWRDAGSQLSLNIGRAVADSILDQERLSDTMRVAARSVAREVIASVVAIGAQRAAMWAAEQLGLVATSKASAAAGASTAIAWAPAAAAVSLATGGTNSGPASAGMASTFALSHALASSSLAGQAHDGLERVPRTGTYLLEAGERVVKKDDNQRLERFLRDQGGGQTINVNFTIEGGDAPSAAEIVYSQRNIITGIIQREFNKRGRKGGPLG